MESVSIFLDRNIIFVFFVYGLAFFAMGLAIWLEVSRSPDDRKASALLFLAAFGLLHGFHEWFEAFTLLKLADITDPTSQLSVEVLRIVLLVVSFLLLFVFAMRLIYAYGENDNNGYRATAIWTIGLAALWFFTVILVFVTRQPCGVDCLAAGDVLSRYLLAIPASLLAAWAMFRQRKNYIAKNMPSYANDIALAAAALLLYGLVGQSFTRATFLFPSNLINDDLFRQLFGVPIQLFRGVMAAGLAIFVIRSLRLFEFDRRQKLKMANESRIVAQRESIEIQKRAQAETEQLNLELQEAVQDLTMLFELSGSLAATLDRDVILKQAMSKIYESIPRIRGGKIMLRESADRPLLQMATVGYELDEASGHDVEAISRQAIAVAEAVVSSGQSYCWTGTKLLPAIRCSCTTGIPDPEQISANAGDRTMGMPLVIQDLVAGSLVLSMDGYSTWLTPRDISLIRTAADQLNLALANAILYEEVQTRDTLRGELFHRVVSAQEQERQGIARDLHDGAGQMATALGLGLAAVSESVRTNPALAERQLIELKLMSGQLVQELQGLIAGLRPTVLDDLGLVPALEGLVLAFEEKTGVETEFKLTGSSKRVLPDIETVVFRIAQEALSNVTKHAQASFVHVLLDIHDIAIGLRIQDNGCGFNAKEILHSDSNRQWGLVGIRERVALVGGACDVVSWPGDGTTIQVSIPLIEEMTDV